ncbi:MAG: hypothetical protein GC191_19930 [Azospirillum sp.]|nr:hypothetical protein [Azospirillum sp.]
MAMIDLAARRAHSGQIVSPLQTRSMKSDRHYEVLVRKRSGWTLDSVVTEKKEALDHAADLGKSEGFASVKVVYSVFDPETGLYEETDVQIVGKTVARAPTEDRSGAGAASKAASPGEGTTAPQSQACRNANDLYTADARRTIAATLGKQLENWVITPTELLHGWEHVRRLQEAGTTMQGAVQKVAIGLSRQGAGGASGLVKQIYDVIAAAERRLNQERTALPAPTTLDLRALIAGTGQTPAAQRTLYSIVTEYLSTAKTWLEKIDALVALLPSDPRPEELVVVDGIGAEILATNAGLSGLLRASRGGGAQPEAASAEDSARRPPIATIGDVLDLIESGKPMPSGGIDAPGARRLLYLLENGRLPECGETLLLRIAQELDSPRLLTGSLETLDVVQEARAIGDIHGRVSSFVERRPAAAEGAGGGQTARSRGGAVTRIAIALENRSEALLRPERLGASLGNSQSIAANVAILLELGHHLVGDLNRRRVGRHLLMQVGSKSAVARLCEVGVPQAIAQLRLVAGWQDEVSGSDLPPDLRDRLAKAMDQVCVDIIEKIHLFKMLARQKPHPIDQALAIADLVGARSFTRGDALNGARRRAIACVTAAGGPDAFATGLAKRAVATERLTALQRFLGNA